MSKNSTALSVTTNPRFYAARDWSATNPRRTLTICEQDQPIASPSCAYLGGFEVNLRSGELRMGKSIVVLQEQPFQILRMLLEHDLNIVTRHEIQQTLWADGTIVDFDHSINTAIKKLRRAFGDSANHPHFIETVARRGYRLIVPVRWSQPGRPLAEKERSETSSLQPAWHFGERRVLKDRRVQVFSDDALGVTVRLPHASRAAVHHQHEKAWRPVSVAAQHRELEELLSHLGKLFAVRIRRLRRSQRCLPRPRNSGSATNQALASKPVGIVKHNVDHNRLP